jgi:hypothetical protein
MPMTPEEDLAIARAQARVGQDEEQITTGQRRPIMQLVSAERLLQSIEMLETVRKMILALLVLMVVVGAALAFFLDYVSDSRTEIRQTRDRTEQIDEGFEDLRQDNDVFNENHERTQRLICGFYRAHNIPLPDNGDCDNR